MSNIMKVLKGFLVVMAIVSLVLVSLAAAEETVESQRVAFGSPWLSQFVGKKVEVEIWGTSVAGIEDVNWKVGMLVAVDASGLALKEGDEVIYYSFSKIYKVKLIKE